MNVELYVNHSDVRVLNKNITKIGDYSLILKDSTDIMHPVFLMDKPELPPNANYIYVPDFKRYYFINSVDIVPGKLLRFRLETDVLMSFKSEINSATVIAERSTNKANRYIGDSIPLLSKQNNIFKAFAPYQDLLAFDSGAVTADTPCILLTVLKG